MKRRSPSMRGRLRLLASTVLGSTLLALSAAAVVAAGPPFPDPVEHQAVYDPAGAISAETERFLEERIDAIEARTGAEIAVYLQVNPGVSPDRNIENAAALMDQWGVGRAGFDDGLVILFDLEPTLVNGRVALYAGSGFEWAYLDEVGRDRILDFEMIPLLRQQDVDGALRAAIVAIDRVVTPERAAALEESRVLNARLGLFGAPVVVLFTLGAVAIAWLRGGRDPQFIESESILMAGPPADMTPALATVVANNRSDQRTVTAALMEIARRGHIRFNEVRAAGSSGPLAVQVDQIEDPESHRPLGAGEKLLLSSLRSGADQTGLVTATRLQGLGRSVEDFHKLVERRVVELGWYRRRPSSATIVWQGIGMIELLAAAILVFLGFLIPMSGLTMLGGAFCVGGVGTLLLAGRMPQRTPEGARVNGMLNAYRRTLRKTMEQARSMTEVSADPAIHQWADTPDKAMVWGIALGLHAEVATVLERSLRPPTDAAQAPQPWYPAWMDMPSGVRHAGAGGGSGGSQGRFSSSGIPNIGGMLSAVGAVGRPVPQATSASSSSSWSSGSSSSSGGGFSGGSSSGGGGSSRGF